MKMRSHTYLAAYETRVNKNFQKNLDSLFVAMYKTKNTVKTTSCLSEIK